MSPTNDQRSPQPSLTERRKAATQLDIARAAAELFAEHGPDGTTAEDIAHRAGVALRTFYRYFRGKQDAVGPLLAAGGDAWRALLADAEPGADLRLTLETAVTATLSAPGDHGPEQLETTRGLLRAAQDDAALRAVWYRVNQESEERLVPVLARLAGERADPSTYGSPPPRPPTPSGSPWRPGPPPTYPRRARPAHRRSSRSAACAN